MATPLLNAASSILCSHAGMVTAVVTAMRVRIAGAVAVVAPDSFTVAGCPFFTGPNPSPCVTLQWLTPATRVRIMGKPALLQTSSSLGKNPAQVPQGPAQVVFTQPRVKGM